MLWYGLLCVAVFLLCFSVALCVALRGVVCYCVTLFMLQCGCVVHVCVVA